MFAHTFTLASALLCTLLYVTVQTPTALAQALMPGPVNMMRSRTPAFARAATMQPMSMVPPQSVAVRTLNAPRQAAAVRADEMTPAADLGVGAATPAVNQYYREYSKQSETRFGHDD
ncbi:hypothetical protein HK102_012607 [Quaeritorhiza haematococci]|nr:hypothetical protein HK102_012607 [Quaeritorhiza haematococci]